MALYRGQKLERLKEPKIAYIAKLGYNEVAGTYE
jgi:hypothetical protein